MQSQIYCGGCRHLLVYQSGASSVRCSICSTISAVIPVETAQLVCAGCRTALVYPNGASIVRCSCCHTINSARPAYAQVNCGHCHTTLVYQSEARSVKCAVCEHVTSVRTNTSPVPIPISRPNGVMLPPPISSTPFAGSTSETVVVENPMTMDESGKLVSSVVVGVTTGKR